MQLLHSARLCAARLGSFSQQLFDWPFWVHHNVIQL
jgi:hypothetical protein